MWHIRDSNPCVWVQTKHNVISSLLINIRRDTRGGPLAKLFMENISVLPKIFSLISSWIRSARRRLRRGRRRGCCRRSGCGAAARTPSAGWCRPAANHSSVSMWLTNEKAVLPAAWPARGRGTSARGSAGPGHNLIIKRNQRNFAVDTQYSERKSWIVSM